MKKMNSKKMLSWIAVIIWMVFIFSLSSQVAEQSNQLSTGITEVIIDAVEKVAPNANFDIIKLNNIIRNNAHFFTYLILGLLVINAARISGIKDFKSLILAILICILYAVSDEIHQFFVPSRGAELKDLIIDSIGALFGIGLYLLIFRIIARRKTDNNQD